MKMRFAVVTACALALPVAASAGQSPQPGPSTKSPQAQHSQMKKAVGAYVGDEAFVKEAAQGGLAEVTLGNLASDKASNADVKSFGQMMVKDHSQANQELMSLAKQKGWTVPQSAGPKHEKEAARLKTLTGAAFDKAYVTLMVEDHENDVKMFEAASQNAKDSDLRAWAEKTLPTLRTHLENARSLHKQSGDTRSKSNQPFAN